LEAPAEEAESTAESPLATPETAAEAAPSEASSPLPAAFVRDGTLYIQNGPVEDAAPVEDCSANDCFIYHLDWSPMGSHLLYYLGSYDGSTPHQIRVADTSGATQTVAEQVANVQPAGWSWDGTAIVYRADTDRYSEAGDGPAQRIQEVWTVAIAGDGTLGEAELHGEVTFGEGCGGGGRSESANAYEREGGFAYGYLSGVTIWTPDDILLYSDNCSTRGVSRFDLANDVALDSYAGGLRSLSINAAGDGWVAINDENQLVAGTPSSLETEVISTTSAPELVFYGKETGTIYYTTLEITGGTDLVEQAAETLDESILIYPYFDQTVPGLIALDPTSGEETELDGNDGYAYARVAEMEDGSVIFSRVEDTSRLQDAVENEELTAENWRSYLPTVDVLRIAPGSNEPTVLVADAAQYTPVEQE
jgi:hypothetical protein